MPTLAPRLVRDFHESEGLPDYLSPVAAGAIGHFLQVGVELFGDLKIQANLGGHRMFSLAKICIALVRPVPAKGAQREQNGGISQTRGAAPENL
jgi:hypothetical protein